MFIVSHRAMSQEGTMDNKEEPSFAYEDVPMILVVDGVGSYNISTIYSEDERIFLSIEDILGVNEIDINISSKGDTIKGFYNTEVNKYFLDYKSGSFINGSKTINISKHLTKLLGVVYLDYRQYADLFGLKMIYNSKRLSIDLKADYETPIFKRIKLDKTRKEKSKKNTEEIIADTVIKREYHLFKPGIFDWNLASTQTGLDTLVGSTQLGLSSELLYGATNVLVPMDLNKDINGKRINYLWKWVDNQKSIIRQADVGKVFLPLLGTPTSQSVGFSIKNSPTTVLKASGYYTITDYTQPNWTVELYINNTLESFTKADASGLFVFNIPIVYGYTTLMLKFYGNRGEERTEERFLVAPNNVMPAKLFQYNLGGGILNDSIYNGALTLNSIYGLNKYLTLGGGVELLSEIEKNQKLLAYSTISFQPINKLLLMGEYVYNTKYRFVTNLYLALNSVLTLDYTLFEKNQKNITTQNTEIRKILFNTPFKIGKSRFIYKVEAFENLLSETNFQQFNNILSFTNGRLNVNSTTSILSTKYKKDNFTTSLFGSYYTRSRWFFSSNTEFDLKLNKLKSLKFEIEKIVKLGTFSVSYENKMLQKSHEFLFRMRLDLNSVKVNYETRYKNNKLSFTEGLIGSVALGGGKLATSNNSMNGKGGIELTYFLDINNNNKFDLGERKVMVKNVKSNSNRLCLNPRDTSMIVYDLIAFQECIIENDVKELENISWKFKKKTYKIMIDPNQLKDVHIPIEVMGEVSGYVYKQIDSSTVKGIGKVYVKVHHLTRPDVVYTIQTESDGYFTFIGLIPGEYAAIVDREQLSRIKMKSKVEVVKFEIKQSNEGDIVDGLEFYLSKIE